MKKTILLIAFTIGCMSANAQYPGRPTFHDSYANYYVMGGYQNLNHTTGVYQTATIQAEVLYSFCGSRIGLTTGPDYFSFSPCGIFLFAPNILKNTIRGEIDNPALLPFMLVAVSALQWSFPLSNHLEISFGWDAVKFTKFKNFSDKFYITGSINAGLTFFIGDNFFLNGYYEYNHNHNLMIGIINWTFSSPGSSTTFINEQSDVFNGHSFGARIGWMF